MDLLGSILGSMAKPPSISEKEKERRKKQQEMAAKMEEKQKQMTRLFRTKTEKRISDFVKDTTAKKLTFEAMEKYERSIVHDVAEVAGVIAHSFGQEDEGDRHVVIWKKEFSPSEDELECLRSGLEWDKAAWAKMKQEEEERRIQERKDRLEEKQQNKKRGNHSHAERSKYQEKYEHLIGKEAALDAAKETKMNKSYGMVSAEMKKDKRTIEDIQAEIRAKKKMKTEHEAAGDNK